MALVMAGLGQFRYNYEVGLRLDSIRMETHPSDVYGTATHQRANLSSHIGQMRRILTNQPNLAAVPVCPPVDNGRPFCQAARMCGRLTLTHPNEALARLFDATLGNDLPMGANYNICPTNNVAVVTADNGRRLRAMRWGFIPAWYKSPTDGPLIINARSDTIAAKPAFRDAIRIRRCILPASGFYEWSAGPNGARLPWYFTRVDGAPLALAALWQRWGDIDTVAMVTTEAGPEMADLHDREPVILQPADWALWLGEAGHGAAPLMRATSSVLTRHRVATAVNSNRAVGQDLIQPQL